MRRANTCASASDQRDLERILNGTARHGQRHGLCVPGARKAAHANDHAILDQAGRLIGTDDALE
jgi:hypothetical protein